MAYSVSLIIFMAISIIMLFAIMVMAAQAAGKSQNKTCTTDGKPNQCQTDCHKYSSISAIMAGVTSAIVIIALIIYLYTNKTHIQTDASALGRNVQNFGQNLQTFGQQSAGGM